MSSANTNNQTTIQFIKDSIINFNSDEKNDILFFLVNNITGVETNTFSIAIDEPVDAPVASVEESKVEPPVASVEESKAEPPIEVSTAEPFEDDEEYLKRCLDFRWEVMLNNLPKIICENPDYKLISVEPNIIKWEHIGNTPGQIIYSVESSGKSEGFGYDSPIEKSITKILRKKLVEYFKSNINGNIVAVDLDKGLFQQYQCEIIKVGIKYVKIKYTNSDGFMYHTVKSILDVYPPSADLENYQYTDEAIALDVEIANNRMRVMSRLDLECCVCYEGCNTKVGTCGHPICVTCCGRIRRGNNPTCPMCRREMNYLRGPFGTSNISRL